MHADTRVPRSPVRQLLVVAAAALGVRLLVLAFWTPGTFIVSDMANYDRIASELAHATVRVNHTFYPIGYPALLAAIYASVGRNFFVVGVVQAVLGAGTTLLAGHLAFRFGASRRLALGAAWATAAYPPFVYYGTMLLTEAVAPFFVTAAIWLIVRASDSGGRRPDVAAAGLCLALATLVRTNLLVLYPLLGAFIWVLGRDQAGLSRRVAFGVLAGALPLLLLMSLHNSRLLGRPTGLSTNGGMNFFLMQADYQSFRSPDATWSPIRNGLKYAAPFVSSVPSYEEAYYYREGFRWFVGRPDKMRHVLANLGEGVGLGLQGYWPANASRPEDPPEQATIRQVLRRSSQAYPWLVLVPVLLSVLVAAARGNLMRPEGAGAFLGLVLVGGIAFTSVVFLADPRMHVPFDAALVACGAALVTRTAAKLRT